jgi:hypothetical protein
MLATDATSENWKKKKKKKKLEHWVSWVLGMQERTDIK